MEVELEADEETWGRMMFSKASEDGRKLGWLLLFLRLPLFRGGDFDPRFDLRFELSIIVLTD